jgi:hypothetical protein
MEIEDLPKPEEMCELFYSRKIRVEDLPKHEEGQGLFSSSQEQEDRSPAQT